MLPRQVERPDSGVEEIGGQWRWFVGTDDGEVSGWQPTREKALEALEIEIQNWWS